MPHVIIDYSGNIEIEVRKADIVNTVHGVMIDSGLFRVEDIKTRAYASDDFMVGEKGQDGTFLFISIAIMEGRDEAQKSGLSQAIHDAATALLPGIDSISVEIRDLQKASYRKNIRRQTWRMISSLSPPLPREGERVGVRGQLRIHKAQSPPSPLPLSLHGRARGFSRPSAL